MFRDLHNSKRKLPNVNYVYKPEMNQNFDNFSNFWLEINEDDQFNNLKMHISSPFMN